MHARANASRIATSAGERLLVIVCEILSFLLCVLSAQPDRHEVNIVQISS